ncbi:hypothetical protein [Parenemella sanctibonifatiensis]|uniref:Uncharacterized protein n=1 Tax=Parenemella sanctibonifatiensis TaxID=2016505 RepID=A0A255EE50_9ACTN|nr:hypothetical protein [Parenemella sanctibonifatiensis]OYN89520.1 hypothetical protein CGZ91_11585 [Parenemella sanctibonifatiensis]
MWAWLDALTLRLDTGRYLADPANGQIALTIVLLATASTLVGQSVVLVINRVRGWGLLFALASNAVMVLAAYIGMGLLLWLLGVIFAEGQTVPALGVAMIVMVSVSPQAFNFLGAIPLLGPLVTRLTSVWGLLITFLAAHQLYPVSIWGAAGLTLAAWLGMLGASTLIAPGYATLRDRVWRRATGRELYADSSHLLDEATIEGSIADLNGPDIRLDEGDR